MDIRGALIGGTGVGSLLMTANSKPVHIPTPYGTVRGSIRPDGILVVARHGATHGVPPHKVNYRALAAALQKLRVETCLASAAVGSLTADLLPGYACVVSDFIDVSRRQVTRFDCDVEHTDFSAPADPTCMSALVAEAETRFAGFRQGAVYANVEGPRYETPAEVRALRSLGADVVGMTAGSEAIAMREFGIAYGCLALVTNLATGVSASKLSHNEVVDAMRQSGGTIVDVLAAAADRLGRARMKK